MQMLYPLNLFMWHYVYVQQNSSSGPINQAYGLHSLRSGEATAACNFGVPDKRLKRRHGRWRSENAKDGYVKDSINDLLFVYKNLGI